MLTPVEKALMDLGPARTERLVSALVDCLGISPQAARQRLSRARGPVKRHHRHLLPKREAFFFLESQRNTERYWDNLLGDLRDTGAVYGSAIDALRARGGVVPMDEFCVVSGAGLALKKQVPSEAVARRLAELGIMKESQYGTMGRCFVTDPFAVVQPLYLNDIIARRRTESIMLDGLREWLKKNGIGSYGKITIRGEGEALMVGQFKWDLTGPSYLVPVRRSNTPNGFVVADVFAQDSMDVHAIKYFIRKVQTYQKTSNSGTLFPILMARSFTAEALTEGHKAGLMLTTPQNLFGHSVARALDDLISTLRNAAAVAAVDDGRLCTLLDQLSEIEGRAGNIRGILFELIAAHIAKREFGGSIDVGEIHSHRESGRTVELDVICVTETESIHFIECKGRHPGGTVSLAEVNGWLCKLPVMRDYVASREHLRERKQTYEIWTTGIFEPEAVATLEAEKLKRTTRPIAWKDGKAVRHIAAKLKLKSIGEALDQHFLKHPLARLAVLP